MKCIAKSILSVVISSLIFISANASATELGRVNCNLLNVRVSPNTECEIIERMPFGTNFEIIYTDNGWYNIRMEDNVTGFVSADYVTIVSKESTASKTAAIIASNAHKYIGYPYSYGSAGPNAFDCSGFTTYLYKQQGVSLPRTSRDQGSFGVFVEKDSLKEGDLLFFSNRKDRVINHVGLYIGNGEFIHASTSTRGVVKDSLSSNYYTRNYVTARRVL